MVIAMRELGITWRALFCKLSTGIWYEMFAGMPPVRAHRTCQGNAILGTTHNPT